MRNGSNRGCEGRRRQPAARCHGGLQSIALPVIRSGLEQIDVLRVPSIRQRQRVYEVAGQQVVQLCQASLYGALYLFSPQFCEPGLPCGFDADLHAPVRQQPHLCCRDFGCPEDFCACQAAGRIGAQEECRAQGPVSRVSDVKCHQDTDGRVGFQRTIGAQAELSWRRIVEREHDRPLAGRHHIELSDHHIPQVDRIVASANRRVRSPRNWSGVRAPGSFSAAMSR